ncbi:hypothetical protein Salat_2354200 [Sesamum alatum]|uniref:Uncharacterized protein n=1 Tax=Sesamum alatum TaxID=300844 RepID=A0AAE1XXQ7_9LAMI|nr:hypothetical protein Salat_2354200 [Sesamum alatum]
MNSQQPTSLIACTSQLMVTVTVTVTAAATTVIRPTLKLDSSYQYYTPCAIIRKTYSELIRQPSKYELIDGALPPSMNLIRKKVFRYTSGQQNMAAGGLLGVGLGVAKVRLDVSQLRSPCCSSLCLLQSHHILLS